MKKQIDYSGIGKSCKCCGTELIMTYSTIPVPYCTRCNITVPDWMIKK